MKLDLRLSFRNRTSWIRYELSAGFCAVLLHAVAAIAQPQIAERSIHYRPGDWVSFPMMRFASCVAADHRTVYFGTTNGIARYRFYDNAWDAPYTVSDGLQDDRIRLLGCDPNSGFLWAATESGLSFLVPSSNQWQNLSCNQLGFKSVTSLGFGREYAWLENNGSFYMGNPLGGPFFTSRKEEADRDETQWKGALAPLSDSLPSFFMDNGYMFLPGGVIQDKELRQYKITDTFLDRFDKMWMSVWGLGAAVADVKSFRIQLLPFGLYHPDVQDLRWDENGLWVGGVRPRSDAEGGITFWETETGQWKVFESRFIPLLRSDDVTSIAVDTDRVWFGTTDGLAQYSKKTGNWNTLDVFSNLWSNRIKRISIGDSALWVATESGINRVRIPFGIVERIQDPRLVRRVVYDIAADGEDVWACTERGIYLYQKSRNAWESVSGWPGTVSHTVTAVGVHPDEVWFTTGDGAEVYYKKDKRWEGFPAFHYPTGGRINAIAVDDSSAWFATEDGVLKYKKSEKRWRRFSIEDGLLDNSVRSVSLDGDYIWFCTARGVTRFYWNAPYRTD